MGPLTEAGTSNYQNAMTDLHRELRRPGIQQRVFSFAHTPASLVRSTLSASEIQHRALTYVPDELLVHIPETENSYSLFDGFQASIPDHSDSSKPPRRKGQRLLDDGTTEPGLPGEIAGLRKDRDRLSHRLEMMGVRKNMCSSEIREIDNKISNLNHMRRIVLDRLADIEVDEAQVEHERECS